MASEDPKTSETRPYGLQKPIQLRGMRFPYDKTTDALGVAKSEFHPLVRGSFEYDFIAKAGADLPSFFETQDTSAAGSPTLDYVTSDSAGVYQLKHDSTSEAQNLSLYQGDSLPFDVSKNLVFMARFKVNAAAIPWTADQRFVIGLGSARDATLDDMTLHAWFRMEGASANLLYESDDGTTDDDDNDSGVDVADDTYINVGIDMRDLTAVAFYVNGAKVGETDMTDASGNVQFFAEIQRDAGAEEEALEFDFIRIEFDR